MSESHKAKNASPIQSMNANEEALEDPTPHRRASDILEIVEAKYVTWEKLSHIIIGFISGLAIGGFVVGWMIATNIADFHQHKEDMIHRVGALELSKSSLLSSIDTNTQEVRKLNKTIIEIWKLRR
jgi:hypothetical protein